MKDLVAKVQAETENKATPAKAAKKRAPAKRTAKPAAKVEAKVFGLQKRATYPKASHILKRSFTLAALVASNHISVSEKTGLVSGKKTGDVNAFKTITASKARPWNDIISDNGAIVRKAQGALKGAAANGYNGEAALIHKMVAFIAKGGSQEFTCPKTGAKETITLTAKS